MNNLSTPILSGISSSWKRTQKAKVPFLWVTRCPTPERSASLKEASAPQRNHSSRSMSGPESEIDMSTKDFFRICNFHDIMTS